MIGERKSLVEIIDSAVQFVQKLVRLAEVFFDLPREA
jgi:hypothetical protein